MSFALIGVLGGWGMGRVGSWFGSRSTRTREEELNHRVRALEADLRVAQRKAEEAAAELEQQKQAAEALREQIQSGTSASREREESLQQLRQQLAEECAKTRDLRYQLTTRAEETIRARARVKEVETELSVTQAGSDVVIDEVNRLAKERAELTGKLESMQAELTGRSKAPDVARRSERDRVTES